jgi:hypothetical protein
MEVNLAAKRSAIGIICLTLFFGFSPSASSTTYITVMPGEDLRVVVESAPDDSVITLAAGTFHLAAQSPFNQGILLQNKANLTVTGQGWNETTVKVASNAGFGFYIGSNVSNLNIEKMRIQGTTPLSVNTHGIGGYSGTTNVRDVRYSDLRVEDVAVGISIDTGSTGVYDGVLVTRNVVTDIVGDGDTPGWGYGIHCGNARNVIISRNMIERVGRHSIYLSRSAAGNSVTIERNCIFHHTYAGSGGRWYLAALVCSRAGGVKIAHNTIVNPDAIALSVEPDEISGWPTTDIVLLNNQIIGARYIGIWVITDDLPNNHAALGNEVVLWPTPPAQPSWQKKFSTDHYAIGQPTSSGIEVPDAKWAGYEIRYDYVAEMSGDVYVMKDGTLDRIAPYTWTYTTCPTNWPDAKAMTALENAGGVGEGRLYIAAASGLYEINPNTWDYIRKAGDWSDVQFAAAAAGYVYMLRNDRLYRVAPGTLDTKIGSGDWSGSRWMWDWAGYVYISKGTDSYRVDPFAVEGDVVDTMVDAPQDVDGDGMEDGWEIHHFGSTANSSGTADEDWDADSFRDLYEYYAGTDPTSAGSRLSISTVSVEDDTSPVIAWDSVTDKCYAVFRSSSLPGPWSLSVSNIAATPPSNVHTDTVANPMHFYRIGLEK